jgi:hypothetical protein
MTVLAVVKDVCAVVGVVIPSSLFSGIANNRTMQEMLALANEMAQRIAYDTRDWTILRKTHTMVGDGVTEAFDLPDNYKRMLLTSEVWRSTTDQAPMRFVPDTNEWLHRRSRDVTDSFGEWTMMGGQLLVEPTLASGQSAYFAYLDKNCVKLAATGVAEVFQADGDSFRIDERCLTLGMIWQWKAQKGSPYAEDMNTYGDALTSIMGRDGPSPVILGRKPISQAMGRVGYPGMVPP